MVMKKCESKASYLLNVFQIIRTFLRCSLCLEKPRRSLWLKLLSYKFYAANKILVPCFLILGSSFILTICDLCSDSQYSFKSSDSAAHFLSSLKELLRILTQTAALNISKPFDRL